MTSHPPPVSPSGWQAFAARLNRAFHAYGHWLIGITWGRFFLLSFLLVFLAAVLQDVPPFSWKYVERVDMPSSPTAPKTPKAPKAPAAPQPASGAGRHAVVDIPGIRIETESAKKDGVEISIGEQGIRIRAHEAAASAPVGVASAASAASGASAGPSVHIQAGDKEIRIDVPDQADAEAIRSAVQEAAQALQEALEEDEAAKRELAEAMSQADAALQQGSHVRTHEVRLGDALPPLAFVWILMSAILKITYKGRVQAEVRAAQATETAEAEALRRQVLEARVAAMQAQVEPHFLFNTLATIDHLIETDPPRASQMQKNLIALLRASMPTMRDANEGGARDLGREMAVVLPYVEILKMRMEERLDAQIEVPDGLHSAEFPAMMIQTLVENAIRHGLEPKPEGGSLRVKAEVVHGKLSVTVADTGVGFGQAPTSGTGVGLANIRERLQLLYGDQAALTVQANQPSGTVVCITVPYRTVGASA